MNESLVILDNLSKTFVKNTQPALKKISATLPKGQILGLVGPDGSGKTTLIRLIAAILHPTEGSITISGKDTVKESGEIHDFIGYMPQKFGLYEDLTVLQNLNLYADLRGVIGKERESTFTRLLKFTGLAPFQRRLSKALSGGMKQKLGLACALIKKPLLLILDEPSVGVDPISRKELWTMVYELLEEGISIIWSTAYLDEAEKCHKILLLSEGELLYEGKPQDFTQKVEGRVFLLSNFEKRKRQVLSSLLTEENVTDSLIQGNDIRIVTKTALDLPRFAKEQRLSIKKTSPRFEDAFIDLLGGGPKKASLLAEKHALVAKGIEKVVIAEKLMKKFGSFVAVDKVSFSVNRGEVFGLLGPNGAGKSTTFKMLCGLLRPSSGSSLINGIHLQQVPAKARAQIGYMPQKFSLYGNLSVRQNLQFFSGIYALHGQRQREVIQRMIEVFDLRDFLGESPDLLPLGYKQRLALACSTMHDPALLFLDEPTSGVDPITRREFWNHINGLVEKGVTILVTTHFMDEAEYCDRIALIYKGRVVHIDTPDSLKKIASSAEHLEPTLEEAFIKLIEEYDKNSL